MLRTVAQSACAIAERRVLGAMLRHGVARQMLLARTASTTAAPDTPRVTCESLIQMQRDVCGKYANNKLFGTKKDGTYHWTTYKDFGTMVDNFRGYLASVGLKPGDRVACISNNRLEWAVAAYATYSLDCVFVPMYESQMPKEWEYILKDADVRVLLVSREEIYAKVEKYRGTLAKIDNIVCFDAAEAKPYSYAKAIKNGAAHPTPPVTAKPDDVCTYIYTSGTTGEPKGVMLTHGNICHNVRTIPEHLHDRNLFSEKDVSLSFLPWAHAYGQTVEMHSSLNNGSAIGISESAQTLVAEMQLVRPTVMFAVPALFNKVYDFVHNKISTSGAVTQFIFKQAMETAVRRRELAKQGRSSWFVDMKYALADRLVLQTLKKTFGGRLRMALVGGAAMSSEVMELIENCGVTVLEGYGLTETSPLIAANVPKGRRNKSVGQPLPEVTVRIVDPNLEELPVGDEGEICVAGPMVMKGYRNKPEATSEAIVTVKGERLFRTGDLGRVDKDNFLFITGRLKEQYKLENGKFVVPSVVENALAACRFVQQAYIYGDNKPYNIALIVPNWESLKQWCSREGVSGDEKALAKNPRVLSMLEKEMQEKAAATNKKYAVPKKFVILEEPFTTANGLLTPKLSMKRHKIKEKYQSTIDQLYASNSA